LSYNNTLHDWLKKLAPLLDSIGSKTKTNRDSFAHVFPRFAALLQLHVITSSSDWFTALPVSFVIGLSDGCGFGCTTLIEKRPISFNKLPSTLYTQIKFDFHLIFSSVL